MQKCPFCAEDIDEVTIMCLSCNQYVKNVSSKSLREDKYRLPPLGLKDKDISHFTDVWAKSYKEIPESIKKKWVTYSEPITQGWILNVIEEWVNNKVASQEEILDYTLAINAKCIQWAWISTAIGIEAGKNQIPENDIPYYLMACNIPLALLLTSFIDVLLENEWIEKKKYDILLNEMHTILRKNSISLAKQGSFHHKKIVPKIKNTKGTPMTKALKRIDIELLKQKFSS